MEEAVLSSALADIAAHGLEGLSVDRVARQAEVNKTSVYRRWPTREALVAAALERIKDELTLKLEDRGSLRGDLLALVTSVAELVTQPLGRAVAQAAFAASHTPELAQMAARQLEAPAAMQAMAAFQRARERGEWSASVDPGPVMSMLIGAVLHRALLEHADVGEAWLDSIVDVAMSGVRR